MMGIWLQMEAWKVCFITALSYQNLKCQCLILMEIRSTQSTLCVGDVVSMRSPHTFGLHSSVSVNVPPTLVLCSSHPEHLSSLRTSSASGAETGLTMSGEHGHGDSQVTCWFDNQWQFPLCH